MHEVGPENSAVLMALAVTTHELARYESVPLDKQFVLGFKLRSSICSLGLLLPLDQHDLINLVRRQQSLIKSRRNRRYCVILVDPVELFPNLNPSLLMI